MDFFPIFYSIIGTAICLALTLVCVVIYITSREPFPPYERDSADTLPIQKPDAPAATVSNELVKTAA